MNIGAKTILTRRGPRALAVGAAGAVLAIAAPSGAQNPGSVQDYRLPPQSTPAPPITGPVDSDTPSARPTSAPAPTPSPSPNPAAAPSPAPTITLPSASPSPSARRTDTPAPTRRTAEPAAPKAADTPAPAPSLTPASEAPPATAQPVEPLPAPEAPEASAAPIAEDAAPAGNTWLLIGGGLLAAIAAGAAFALLRRPRRRAPEQDWPEQDLDAEYIPDAAPKAAAEPDLQPSAPATLPRPSLPAQSAFAPQAPPAPQQQPAPKPAPDSTSTSEPPVAPPAARPKLPEPAFAHIDGSADQPLAIQLEAQNLNCSLVYASLAYRLALTNQAQTETGPLRIFGDIISAHASLSQRDQLSLVGAPKLHDLASIPPGESVTVSGQLRMAMAQITPIQQGRAPLFVPLARFQVAQADAVAAEAQSDAPATTRVFVVGQAAESPGGGLRPFRLDQMPGTVRELDQRLVEPGAA